MFTSDQHQLVDFGGGRKLERFGPYLLDRPCPAAEGQRRARPDIWAQAEARYDAARAGAGSWSPRGVLPQSWTVSHAGVTFELRPSRFGHLGLFPEQAPCWDWTAAQVARAGGPLKVLNLFAHTGGSSLAAAGGGAEVVHIDAARNTTVRARNNARLSRLDDAPIRWIADDATRFASRELRRGSRYDAVVLDPPTYGHGPRGAPWKLADHLPGLLAMCGRLTAGRLAFVLLTCHTPGHGPAALRALLTAAGLCGNRYRAKAPGAAFAEHRSTGSGKMVPPAAGPQCEEIEIGPLQLTSRDGRKLPCGAFARWSALA